MQFRFCCPQVPVADNQKGGVLERFAPRLLEIEYLWSIPKPLPLRDIQAQVDQCNTDHRDDQP